MGSPRNTAAYIKEVSTPPPPGSPQAVPIPGTEREGRTPIYRNWRFRDGPLLWTFDPAVQTTYDLFENAAARYPNSRCLGTRNWDTTSKSWENKFEWITYSQVADRVKAFGAGLVDIYSKAGLKAEKCGVGLWSQNRAEWQIADLGILSQSLFTVSLYETLGVDTTEYIINHADLSCVVCSLPHVPVLLDLAPRIPSLKIIVSIDPLDAGEQDGHSKSSILNVLAAKRGIQVYAMSQVEELGVKSGRLTRPPRKDDIVTINYTSGTTGMPKGVVLKHENFLAAITSGRTSGTVSHKDVHISYLPLAHIYGRLADMMALAEGAAIGYFRGDILGLVDDMKLLHPSGFYSVPRLFNRFNSALKTATVDADGFKGALSRHVINTKKANMRVPPPAVASNKHMLYDRIWTAKVRAALGLQRAHSMLSGSAPIDPDVHEFLRAALGNDFFQGYGLTETGAVVSVSLRNDFSLGHVGPPAASVEVCLESVPDLEYLVTDKPNPRGELLVRGPVVFKEYYKNEEETTKALEKDGWFHTGDIAEIDSLGRIKIIDRKKNMLKLSQGEYISPERIENVYLGSTNLIATAYVHGDSTQSSLVAVFGVDPVSFAPFASKILNKNISPTDTAALKAAGTEPAVKKALLRKLDKIGRNHKFNSYERVRNVYLDVDPFTIDNEFLTPTLKLKRAPVAKAFRPHIDRMYAELAAETPAAKL